jgi:hypothetical protein
MPSDTAFLLKVRKLLLFSGKEKFPDKFFKKMTFSPTKSNFIMESLDVLSENLLDSKCELIDSLAGVV